MNTIPTDPALATPAQNSENTNNPLLAVASSAVVLPDCSRDVDEEGLDNRLTPSQKRIIRSVREASLIMKQRELALLELEASP
jgi:hypothetical protein